MIFLSLLFYFLLIEIEHTACKSQVYSTTNIEELVNVRNKLIHQSKSFVEKLEKRNQQIKSYIKNLEGEIDIMNTFDDKEEYLSNPICAYRLVKRLTIDLDRLTNTFTSNMRTNFVKSIKAIANLHGALLPTISDVSGISQAMVRLQKIYDLNETDIVHGNVEKYWNATVTGDDLYWMVYYYKYNTNYLKFNAISRPEEDETSDDYEFRLLAETVLSFSKIAEHLHIVLVGVLFST